MPRLAPAVVVIVALGALFVAAGCGPVVSSNNTVTRKGPHVGGATFAEIRPGKTTADWVLATLGEPTSRATLDDGSEVWRWSATEHKSGSGSVWLLYDGHSHKELVTTHYVQVADGVVTKKWRD